MAGAIPETMRALRLHRRGGPARLRYEEAEVPFPAVGDVLVRVHAASFTPTELEWPSTRVDRSGHDRRPVIPGHEVSGVVAALGFGTSGPAVGDESGRLEEWVEPVDLVLDLVGGEFLQRSWPILKAGGRLVSAVEPPDPEAAGRADLRARYFIVEADRVQLGELARLIDGGHLRPIVARVFDLVDGAKAFDAKQDGGLPGKAVLQVAPDGAVTKGAV